MCFFEDNKELNWHNLTNNSDVILLECAACTLKKISVGLITELFYWMINILHNHNIIIYTSVFNKYKLTVNIIILSCK